MLHPLPSPNKRAAWRPPSEKLGSAVWEHSTPDVRRPLVQRLPAVILRQRFFAACFAAWLLWYSWTSPTAFSSFYLQSFSYHALFDDQTRFRLLKHFVTFIILLCVDANEFWRSISFLQRNRTVESYLANSTKFSYLCPIHWYLIRLINIAESRHLWLSADMLNCVGLFKIVC